MDTQTSRRPGAAPPLPRSHQIPESLLVEEFSRMQQEDPFVAQTALDAYREMASVPFDNLDYDPRTSGAPASGLVQRRAPLNPLRSPLMGPFRRGDRRKPKVSDPALQGNPLRGRLVVTFVTTGIIFLIYLQSLILSFTYSGKAPGSSGSIPGPLPHILKAQGGLDTNSVRDGEVFRLFWAMWLHADWMHVIFNLLCQFQYLLMLEPDFGFIRTCIIFFGSAITGNLFSCVGDPCSVTVGSSGGLFGLMGAMLPYWIEYWKSIPRPGLIVLFTVVVVVLCILMGFSNFGGNTDNWTHLGGALAGLLLGMGTITSLTACEDFTCRSLPLIKWCCPPKAKPTAPEEEPNSKSQAAHTNNAAHLVGPDGKIRKRVVKRNQVARTFQQKLQPSCKCGAREWSCRLISWGVFLVLLFLLIWYTFVDYEFQPTGHISFSGVRSCCCCYWPRTASTDTTEIWTCHYCEILHSGKTWGDICSSRQRIIPLEAKLMNTMRKIAEPSTSPRRVLAASSIDYSSTDSWFLGPTPVRLSNGMERGGLRYAPNSNTLHEKSVSLNIHPTRASTRGLVVASVPVGSAGSSTVSTLLELLSLLSRQSTLSLELRQMANSTASLIATDTNPEQFTTPCDAGEVTAAAAGNNSCAKAVAFAELLHDTEEVTHALLEFYRFEYFVVPPPPDAKRLSEIAARPLLPSLLL